MTYTRFLAFSVSGSLLWVGLFGIRPLSIGGIRAVRENFALVIRAIVALSIMPLAVEHVRARLRRRSG